MKTRKLGPLTVSAVGMGCMGFTHACGDPPPEEEGIRLVHEAFDEGCNFFDTAEMYSYFKNEKFVGKALKELPRDKVVISDKFWPTALPGQEEPKLSEPHLRWALEDSLRRLGTDYIDLYTEHQMAGGSEEEVADLMGRFIREGKIRAWGQSSPTADQIRRAHAPVPSRPALFPQARSECLLRTEMTNKKLPFSFGRGVFCMQKAAPESRLFCEIILRRAARRTCGAGLCIRLPLRSRL